MARRTRLAALVVGGATATLGLASSCSCVAEGTPVLTPAGWRPVELLRIGDEIFAYDVAAQRLVPTLISHVRSSVRECMMLETAEHQLVCTPDHPVYCPRDEVYADAGDWALGRRPDVLVVQTDQRASVRPARASVHMGLRKVFDLTVEHALHNFVAAGLLVHNKSYSDPTVIFRCDPAGRT